MDVKIEYKGQVLAISSLGGGIKEYYTESAGKRRDIVYGYATAEQKDGCMGDVLSPFPGRMVNDEYEWEGKKYQISDSLKLSGRALHAFVDQFEWSVEKVSDTVIRASFRTGNDFDDKGYPFDLQYYIEYILGENKLKVITNVKNLGKNNAPFGIGYHPYFAVADKVDQMHWQVPAEKVVEFDSNLKPTGKLLEIQETGLDFREAATIGDKVIDNCFFDLQRDASGLFISTLSNPETGEQIVIWQDDSYPYFQTYSSDTIKKENHRRAMALEPQTCCGFSINMPELGLITLKPEGEFNGTWGIIFG